MRARLPAHQHAKTLGLRIERIEHGAGAGIALWKVYRHDTCTDPLYQGTPEQVTAWLEGYGARLLAIVKEEMAQHRAATQQQPPAEPCPYCEGTGRGPGGALAQDIGTRQEGDE